MRVSRGQRLPRRHRECGINDECHEADDTQIRRYRTKRNSQPGGECQCGGKSDGHGMVAAADGPGKHRDPNQQAGGKHSPAALRVRVITVAKRDIECACAHDDSSGNRAQSDTRGQRQCDAQSIPQSQPGSDLVSLKADDALPETGPRARL